MHLQAISLSCPSGSVITRPLVQVLDSSSASDADVARHIARQTDARGAEHELCRRFAPRIRAYGLRHLRDPDAADDLAQRVLVLTLEKLRAGQVREPERIASFILGSARLTAQSIRRGRGRTEPLHDDHTGIAEQTVATSEPLGRERIRQCLGRLTERERSVIVLSFFQEATAREIGDSLGLEPGNVRVIRHRALCRLRAWLAPEAEDER